MTWKNFMGLCEYLNFELFLSQLFCSIKNLEFNLFDICHLLSYAICWKGTHWVRVRVCKPLLTIFQLYRGHWKSSQQNIWHSLTLNSVMYFIKIKGIIFRCNLFDPVFILKLDFHLPNCYHHLSTLRLVCLTPVGLSVTYESFVFSPCSPISNNNT